MCSNMTEKEEEYTLKDNIFPVGEYEIWLTLHHAPLHNLNLQ